MKRAFKLWVQEIVKQADHVALSVCQAFPGILWKSLGFSAMQLK
jgi:hypothetical protein